MIEMRATLNFRSDDDFNSSFTFVHLVTDRNEAEQAGAEDASILTAYLKGYTDELKDDSQP